MVLRSWEGSWMGSSLGNGPSWISCWLRGSSVFKVHGSVSFPSFSPFYLLRDALNKSVLQVNVAGMADQCWRNIVWRSAVDTVIYIPYLLSLEDLFSQLLERLPTDSLQFSTTSRIVTVWDGILSNILALPEVAYNLWLADMEVKRHGSLDLPQDHFVGVILAPELNRGLAEAAAGYRFWLNLCIFLLHSLPFTSVGRKCTP